MIVIFDEKRSHAFFNISQVYKSQNPDGYYTIRLVSDSTLNSGIEIAKYGNAKERDMAFQIMVNRIANADSTKSTMVFAPSVTKVREMLNHTEEHYRDGKIKKRTGGS